MESGIFPVAPEHHVFQKMGNSVILFVFKTQTSANEHGDLHRVNMRHLHRHYRQAVGQSVPKIFNFSISLKFQ